MLNTWNYLVTAVTLLEHLADGGTWHAPIVVGASTENVHVTRIDPDTLELRTEGGYLREPSSLLVRSPRDAFTPGHSVRVGKVTIVVHTTTPDGRSRDLDGLWLVDGVTFPSLPAKNLTFTLMANASRIAATGSSAQPSLTLRKLTQARPRLALM